MTSMQTGAPKFSALQLAWLQELGIEKPWLPSEQDTVGKAAVGSPASAALKTSTAAVHPTAAKAKDAVTHAAASQRPPGPSQRRVTTPSASPSSEVQQVDTQALATQALDMLALAETITSCQACGLCRERQNTVFGEGATQPAIMVIGAAPSDLDDRSGKPFVDRPGLMLDNMLSAINTSRHQNVYVTNVVKCRTPGNRDPRPAELAACKPYLLRQIEFVRPFSILVVGRAAQSLLGTDEPLEKLRQKTHSLMVAGQKIPLIVTHHPVSLLNHPSDKAAVWQDLQLVKTVSGL